jgi:hypothetical protein
METVTSSSEPSVFDRVRAALEADGPIAAIDRLCEELRQTGDFANLFYALLMRKRVELGVTPFPTGPAAELPTEAHEPYENAIREAGREVGYSFLRRGDIPKAWHYFRMLGEPEPIRQAIADYQPGEDDDPYPVIEIAWQQGVLPQKGFDLVLDRSGVCSAITMVSSSDLGQNPDLRTYCIQRLVHSLHGQLSERLRVDLAARGVTPMPEATVTQLLTDQPDLFVDEGYYIDTSHLSSVVQMAMQLPRCPELDMARELCAYGEKLSPNLKGRDDPPFEETYADYRHYLNVLSGENALAGLKHFRTKAEAGKRDGYLFPAEVLVNLLVKVGQIPTALDVAREYLSTSEERYLSCPGVAELTRQIGDYVALADTSREKGDPVNYLAGLIAERAKSFPRR